MAKLNVEGIAEVQAAKCKRKEALRKLTVQPFDLNNRQHTEALARYVDNFELLLNQMYLFQGLSTGLVTWGSSWFVSLVLPIPQFANSILSACLYLGAAGYILEHFSMNDFHEEFLNMQQLYNWCLKNSEATYDESTDNSHKLVYPDIQRLIKLLAPLSKTEFMIAWPKVTNTSAQQPSLYRTIVSLHSFFSAPKPGVDHNLLLALKTNVEQRAFDVGVFKALQHALHYFVTSPQFRELFTKQVAVVRDVSPGAVINAITAAFAPSR